MLADSGELRSTTAQVEEGMIAESSLMRRSSFVAVRVKASPRWSTRCRSGATLVSVAATAVVLVGARVAEAHVGAADATTTLAEAPECVQRRGATDGSAHAAPATVSGFPASATREKFRGWCRAQREKCFRQVWPPNVRTM